MSGDSISGFLDKLSAATPTPGGGSAAGLTGSVAASLVAMVAQLTLGKKSYQPVEAEMRAVLAEATRLRDELRALVDRDSDAFNDVMAAHKLPRETDAEKRVRQEKLQAVLKHATEIPYQTASRCYRALELAEIVTAKGAKSTVSDGGAAACLAEGALQAALLNVAINLAAISDEAFKSEYTYARERLSRQAQAKRHAIVQTIAERLTV
jgi:formiminotetrahydrofolate cyclodeaminase